MREPRRASAPWASGRPTRTSPARRRAGPCRTRRGRRSRSGGSTRPGACDRVDVRGGGTGRTASQTIPAISTTSSAATTAITTRRRERGRDVAPSSASIISPSPWRSLDPPTERRQGGWSAWPGPAGCRSSRTGASPGRRAGRRAAGLVGGLLGQSPPGVVEPALAQAHPEPRASSIAQPASPVWWQSANRHRAARLGDVGEGRVESVDVRDDTDPADAGGVDEHRAAGQQDEGCRCVVVCPAAPVVPLPARVHDVVARERVDQRGLARAAGRRGRRPRA